MADGAPCPPAPRARDPTGGPALPSRHEPTAAEQLMLELVNRARLDPAAEARRLDVGLGDGLPPGAIGRGPLQPLAWNLDLSQAAAGHSDWMRATATVGHAGRGGSSPADRVEAAGYRLDGPHGVGENVGMATVGDAADAARALHADLFGSAGHRRNLLDADHAEVGVGLVTGRLSAGVLAFDLSAVTQAFAWRGDDAFLAGVATSDADRDGLYDAGEGRGGWRVDVAGDGREATATGTAGGYALRLPEGEGWASVTVKGGGASLSARLRVGDGNVKLDVVDGTTLAASADLRLGAGAQDGRLLGAGDLSLWGNGRGNRLDGGAGDDVVRGGGGRDALAGGRGDDRLEGGRGADAFRFRPSEGDDRVTDLHRGDRVLVDVADPDDLSDWGYGRRHGREVGDDYVLDLGRGSVRFEDAGRSLVLDALDLV